MSKLVHYESDGVFDAPVDKIWKYMAGENHEHSFIKSTKILSQSGNQMSIEQEILNPDGTTYRSRLDQTINPPTGWEGTFSGGPIDGATMKHTYIPMGNRTKVELKADHRPMPGVSESEQLKMIDEFYTRAFDEDNANLQKMR